MRIIYLFITLAVLVGCKTEDASVTASETTISGITVPANMSGIPSSN